MSEQDQSSKTVEPTGEIKSSEEQESSTPKKVAKKAARKTARKQARSSDKSPDAGAGNPAPQPSEAEQPKSNVSQYTGPEREETPARQPESKEQQKTQPEHDKRTPENGDGQQKSPQHTSGGDQSQGGQQQGSSGNHSQGSRHQGGNRQGRNRKKKNKQRFDRGGGGGGGGARRGALFMADGVPVEADPLLDLGQLPQDEFLQDVDALQQSYDALFETGEEIADFDTIYSMPSRELRDFANDLGISFENVPSRLKTIQEILSHWQGKRIPIQVEGTLEVSDDGFGMIVQSVDSYRVRALSPFVPECLIEHHGLLRGHTVKALLQAPRENESCPVALKIESVMGDSLEKVSQITPFTELVPYYPLERILLENSDIRPENNLSMRIIDLISPIGFGQRGLIVAPPRTGKTVILQGIANAVQLNYPNAHLIVLLIDERPEEVTDFRRRVDGEVVSSTFDESAGSHVHAAEMVIEKARRMVEVGRDVVILLDSITRLARAYNTLMPNSGKILSGGVEANALQKPKRFFGSARNIENGGSLTIMGTALVETGSKMDEVIFEEFKGTGNMELHLDRSLVEKRIFPALAMDKSGTRKEELLYHPDEMQKVFSLRRATRGVPPVEAMEMLIQRVKKTNSNAEFLMTLSR